MSGMSSALPPDTQQRKRNFRKGFFTVMFAHGIAALVSLSLEHLHAPRTGEQYVPQPLFLYVLGISQMVYVLPMILGALILGKKRAVKGILIAAALTFLLNGLYCGLMFLGWHLHWR